MGITEDYVEAEVEKYDAKHLLEHHQAAPTPPPTPPITDGGSQGHGAESKGGYGGRVIEVTHLGDSGPGSMRAALTAKGSRTAIFRVGGTIDLKSDIKIRNPYITIAGQSAPGDGIAYKNAFITFYSHDAIAQYIRFRGGAISAFTFRPTNECHDNIIDHCSLSGSRRNTIGANWKFGKPDIERITVQHTLIAEAQKGHPTAMMWSGNSDLFASPPIIGSDHIHHISNHSNFFCHNGHRNHRASSKHTEEINCVVYNWGNRIGGDSKASESDWINNYFKRGPMSSKRALAFQWKSGYDRNNRCKDFPPSSIYIAGNILEGVLDDPNEDNWFLLETNERHCGDFGNPVPLINRRFTPLAPAPIPVGIIPAVDVPDAVLPEVGCSRLLNEDGSWRDARDKADGSYVSDFHNGTGPSSSPTTIVPSTYKNGQPYDHNGDGIGRRWKEDVAGIPVDEDHSRVRNPNTGRWYLKEFLEGLAPR